MASNSWSSLLATALVVATYVSIFSTVIITDYPPEVPTHTRGLNLAQAWVDLHVLAARPRPYNSHANDVSRDYLLSRLQPIVDAHPHVHLDDDLHSNGTWDGTYFEGSNVLIKVDGKDPDASAVLFSAHFDSVPTSTGSTDDGMGIVTLLQLFTKFAQTEHRRTAIFNFNNGEEDGLNGGYAFLRHPWSNITSLFLNLEGAGSGGRPILFRSTSATPLRAFHVPHPHTNVLAADVFAQGLVRSETDYVVYANDGHMQGLDLAFYKGRSRYHTRYDAVPWLEGGERTLWAMMETSEAVGSALLDQEEDQPAGVVPGLRRNDAVYFDLFGQTTMVFSLEKLRIYDIVFLSSIPIATALLLVCQRLAAVSDWGYPTPNKINFGWIRFWAALLLIMAGQVLLFFGHAMSNPYIVYSSPYLVVLSAILLIYLTLSVSFSFPLPERFCYNLKENTTNYVLMQLLILSYMILFLLTVLLPTPIGGTYPITALATCVFLAWAVGIVAEIMTPCTDSDAAEVGELSPSDRESAAEQEEREGEFRVLFEQPLARSPPPPQSQPESDEGEPRNGEHTAVPEEEEETGEPTETTPLIGRRHTHKRRLRLGRVLEHGEHPTGWSKWLKMHSREIVWTLQFLIAVPIPITLFAHLAVLLTGSLPQTVVDGGSIMLSSRALLHAANVLVPYTGLLAISVFLLLPLAPFLPTAAWSSVADVTADEPRASELGDIPPAEEPRIQRSVTDAKTTVTPCVIFAVAVLILVIAYNTGLAGLLLTPHLPLDQRLGFPFSVEAPLKVSFQQKVEIQEGWNVSKPGFDSNGNGNVLGVRACAYLLGIPRFMDEMVLPALPSAREAMEKGDGDCVPYPGRPSLLRCGWELGQNGWPLPAGHDHWRGIDEGLLRDAGEGEGNGTILVLRKNPWLRSSLERVRNDLLRIKLKGRNTRSCKVYFDGGAEVKSWRVLGGADGDYGRDQHQVSLWSRTWEREFVLDVEVESGKELKGRVGCEWVEYESGLVDNGSEREVEGDGTSARARIPVYEEVLKFLPRWAVATNLKVADGLVEVWSEFEI